MLNAITIDAVVSYLGHRTVPAADPRPTCHQSLAPHQKYMKDKVPGCHVLI